MLNQTTPSTPTMQSKTLLVSSFHRSGSSMVGKILSESGLFMGENLLKADRSNPDGHFEDIELMQSHEKVLKKFNTSWQFDGSTSVKFEQEDLRHFQSLVNHRNQQNKVWGFKDPRACLFLDDWEQILGESGFYFFLYRHYSQCISSLYRRHSRNICLNQIDNINHPNVKTSLKFWSNPDLAAKMWLAYNRKLYTFYISHREKSLLVSQQTVLSGYPLVEKINKQFDFQLKNSIDNVIQNSYTHNEINQIEINGISKKLVKEMDDLWDAMNQVANIPSSTCNIILKSNSSATAKKIETLINRFNPSEKHKEYLQPKVNKVLKPLEVSEKIQLYLQNFDTDTALGLVPNLLNDTPLKAESWILAGSAYMQGNDYEKAQHCFSYAIVLNPNKPYFYMHLGNAFLYQDKKIEAEHFYQIAINKNSNNALFYFQLGKLHYKYNEFEKAKYFYKQALNKNPENPRFINTYSQCLLNLNKTEEAKMFLKDKCKNTQQIEIIDTYASLLLGLGKTKEASIWYNKKDLILLKKVNLRYWLQDILNEIQNTKMRENFLFWVNIHWQDIQSS